MCLGIYFLPSAGGNCSLLCLPATPLSWSQTLEGVFEQYSSRALNLALCIASGTSEIQGHCLCKAGALATEVPGHKKIVQTLFVYTYTDLANTNQLTKLPNLK